MYEELNDFEKELQYFGTRVEIMPLILEQSIHDCMAILITKENN